MKGGHVSHVLSPECQVELPQQNTDGPDIDNGGPAVVVEDRDVQGREAGEGDDEQLQASCQSRPGDVSLDLVTQVRRELRAEPTFLCLPPPALGTSRSIGS